MKGEERMICHFYRDNWPCKVGVCRPCARHPAGVGWAEGGKGACEAAADGVAAACPCTSSAASLSVRAAVCCQIMPCSAALPMPCGKCDGSRSRPLTRLLC
jgi:hypothetical protein